MRPLEAELLDPVAHLVAIDPEQLTCVRLVAVRALERLHQQLLLHLLEVDAFGRQPEAGRNGVAREGRKVLGDQPLTIHQQHRPLDRVAKLADIARPAVVVE